jgi:hypothetical protein
MTLSHDLSSSSLHIPRRVSADPCLHVVTLPVQAGSAASQAIPIFTHIPSHHSYCSVSAILSLVLLGKMPFNTQ